jgi:hypothetical protein
MWAPSSVKLVTAPEFANQPTASDRWRLYRCDGDESGIDGEAAVLMPAPPKRQCFV